MARVGTATDATWRRIRKLTTATPGIDPDLFDEAPLIELIGVEPVRNSVGDLVGTRTWVRDPATPLGRRLDLRPGDYTGPVLIDSNGRAHPVE